MEFPKKYRRHSVPPNRIPDQLAAPRYRDSEAPMPAWELALRGQLAHVRSDGFGGLDAIVERAREARLRLGVDGGPWFTPEGYPAILADAPEGWPWCAPPESLVYTQPGTGRRRLWEPWEVEAGERRRMLLAAVEQRTKGDYSDRPNVILDALDDPSTSQQLVEQFIRPSW